MVVEMQRLEDAARTAMGDYSLIGGQIADGPKSSWTELAARVIALLMRDRFSLVPRGAVAPEV